MASAPCVHRSTYSFTVRLTTRTPINTTHSLSESRMINSFMLTILKTSLLLNKHLLTSLTCNISMWQLLHNNNNNYKGSVKRIPPQPIFTFQNLITSSPVANGMTGQVWWQSDLNCRQEVVHKHVYIYIYIYVPIYLPTYRRRRKHKVPSSSVGGNYYNKKYVLCNMVSAP